MFAWHRWTWTGTKVRTQQWELVTSITNVLHKLLVFIWVQHQHIAFDMFLWLLGRFSIDSQYCLTNRLGVIQSGSYNLIFRKIAEYVLTLPLNSATGSHCYFSSHDWWSMVFWAPSTPFLCENLTILNRLLAVINYNIKQNWQNWTFLSVYPITQFKYHQIIN